jgi:putative serine protease PepD
MSDNQGERPESTPTDESRPEATPDVAAQTASTTPVPPTTPPVPPAPVAPQASMPAPHPAPQAPQTSVPQAPQHPAQPAAQAPQFAAPHAYGAAQQPQAPRAPQYAGQPPYGQPQAQARPPYATASQATGQAFGVTQTQPTLPLTDSVPASNPPARKPSGAGKVVGLIVAAAIVGGAAGLGGAYAGNALWGSDVTTPAAGPTTVTVNDTDSVNATTAIAAKTVPSVVTISASDGSSGGTGSGVVLTADGYVVTNTHVVTLDGATADPNLRVTTSDGRVFDAEVIGLDPTYDLAVIKLVDATDLTPIDFADSSALNVGDQTVAVGAPLGLSNSVTTGIVSALNRSIEIASSAAPDSSDTQDDGQQTPDEGQGGPFFFDFGQGDNQGQATETIKISVIQTDAAINPGNSGGALVDSDGKLIGVNVAIASAGSSSGQAGNIGVGFAIPSDVVQRVTDEIIENGEATHGLLGASVQDAANVEGTTITGAYIESTVAGGAAAQGGLAKGDIVTQFNGVPVTDATDLTAQVRAAAAGSTATVTFVRDGQSRTIEVTLGSLADAAQ